MLQAPSWLPYRARSAWDDRRINWAVRNISTTKATPACLPGSAAAEVYLLVCKRDLRIAAVTLKSLLRFDDLRLAVTLTEDGSLDADDRSWLDTQIPGARWLPRRSDLPPISQALASFPHLAKLYASTYHPICKLLHPALLARTDRVIILDPDTAFFRRPDHIQRWVNGDLPGAFYLRDLQDETSQVPLEVREAFAKVAATVTPSNRQWGLRDYFFNSGLLMYRVSQLDLQVAEAYLEWRESAPVSLRQGKAGIWFGDWTPEQTCYLALFAVMDPPSVAFDHEYHLGGVDGFTFNHFLRHYLVKPETLNSLGRLIKTF